MKVALALYSVREYTQSLGFEAVIQKAKALGFEGVEFAGFGDVPADVMKGYLEKYDMAVTSSHIALPPLLETLDETIAYNKALGNNRIVCAWAPMDDAETFHKTVEGLRKASEKIRANGMQLFYHNHWQELTFKIDGTTGFDRLFQIFTPDELRPEADVCWLNRGGVSPVEYTKKYGKITPIWHIKDSAGSSMMSLDKPKDGVVAVEKSDTFRFTIAGQGEVGIADVVKAAADTSIEWLIYENDDPQPEAFYVVGKSADFLHGVIASL